MTPAIQRHGYQLNSAPRLLLCWSGHPGYGPPPLISENQVVIFSHHDKNTPGLIDPPRQLAERQDYDLKQAVEQFASVDDFDLVVVCCAASYANKLRNVEAFSCPKVLFVTDTHHLKHNPIQYVLDYKEITAFDCITALFNRDHMRWFGTLPNTRLGWFPGLTIHDIRKPISENRKPVISFVGHWKRNHPRRLNFIRKIEQQGLPFEAATMSREDSAMFFANNLISFNCSLNGDLNMRVYEILSAGGFLLTDRLASFAGLDDVLVDGRDYVAYDGFADFADKAKYYLAHPKQALQIARAGQEKYIQHFATAKIAQHFFDWVLQEKHPNHDFTDRLHYIDGAGFAERLAAYERLQRLQLFQENVKVLAIGARAHLALDDSRDLIRVKRYAINSGDDSKLQNVQYHSEPSLIGTRWAAIVIDRENLPKISDLDLKTEVVLEI